MEWISCCHQGEGVVKEKQVAVPFDEWLVASERGPKV
jgi:hypothetical protein